MSAVMRLARLAGVDRATFFSAAGKVWLGIASFVSMGLVLRNLSAETQGLYYTFNSLLALQVFLELGFSYVIVQVAAHEFAIGQHHEDEQARRTAQLRLIALLRLGLRWYAVVAVAFWLVCSAAGEIFFRATDAGPPQQWQTQWLGAVALFSLCILFNPVYAIQEGCNRVATVARTRLVQDFCGFAALWYGLSAHYGLYAITLLYLGKLAGAALGILGSGLHVPLRQMLREPAPPAGIISWRKEIFPFQWKIALSWASGYLIFQLFSPVLFALQGAKVAGQAGMTIALYSGINAVMLTWISARAPLFCQLVALRQWQRLNQAFDRTVLASSAIIAGGLLLFTVILVTARGVYPALSERILDNGSLACFALVSLVNHLVFAMAAYVRAFKDEPFLRTSVAGAVLTAGAVLVLAHSSAFAVAAGYCAVATLVSFPWAVAIFLARRRNPG